MRGKMQETSSSPAPKSAECDTVGERKMWLLGGREPVAVAKLGLGFLAQNKAYKLEPASGLNCAMGERRRSGVRGRERAKRQEVGGLKSRHQVTWVDRGIRRAGKEEV